MKKISLSNMVIENIAAGVAPGASGGCRPVPGEASSGGPGIEFIKRKKPDWLRAKLPGGPGYKETLDLVNKYKLHTVCSEARCPNLGECWERGTATMMILGDTCTRSCGFCHIATGRPPEYDMDEPRRVGEAAALMNLKHLVITSVDRDELPDGGAELWAETIREIRRQSPGTQVEVLIPDFNGDWDALQLVLDERPDILNHNVETVPRLYKVVRPQAKFEQSVELLRRGKAQGLTVKTGIMVGIGERDEEVEQMFHDLVAGVRVEGVAGDDPATTVAEHWVAPDPNRGLSEQASAQGIDLSPGQSLHLGHGGEKPELGDKLRRGGYLVEHSNPLWQHDGPAKPPEVAERIAELSYPHKTYPGVHETLDILTIGQYLQPTRNHLPITHWVTPAQFVGYKAQAEEIGIRHCESGPLVRSSYHADDQVLKMEARV